MMLRWDENDRDLQEMDRLGKCASIQGEEAWGELQFASTVSSGPSSDSRPERIRYNAAVICPKAGKGPRRYLGVLRVAKNTTSRCGR